VQGFENSYVANFQKELYFHKEFYYRLLIIVADFIVSVSITLITKSVYGLIFGLLFSSLAGTIASWILLSDKPKFRFDLKQIKTIMSFGKWINLNSIFYYITVDLDTVVIGRVMGVASLGLYQIGQKFSFTPLQEIADIFGKVTFPVYAKISDDSKRLAKAYLKILFSLAGIEIIISVILLIFAKEFILILVGPKWLVTEGIFRLFVVYGLISALVGTNGSLFLSIGRQDFLTKLSLFRVIILLPLIILGVHYFGLNGAILALIVSLLIIAPLSILNTIRLFAGKFEAKNF
jgi:O-antigen/teichoic acid export membrane protein